MSGDWIKMRADLGSAPKVVRIMSALQADRLRVVGALHAIWGLFDAHSEDGKLDGYTPELLDAAIGWPGFTDAMMAVRWIERKPYGLVMPRFSEHNGKSAKRRATEAERKRNARKTSASDADKSRTKSGPEKRREDIKNTRAREEPVDNSINGATHDKVKGGAKERPKSTPRPVARIGESAEDFRTRVELWRAGA